MEFREPLYKDQYEQEHLKPSVSKLLLSPEIYCRVQALLAQAQGSQGSPADNSALLQFLIKKGFTPKVQDADVTEEDLNYVPIKTVRLAACTNTVLQVKRKIYKYQKVMKGRKEGKLEMRKERRREERRLK